MPKASKTDSLLTDDKTLCSLGAGIITVKDSGQGGGRGGGQSGVGGTDSENVGGKGSDTNKDCGQGVADTATANGDYKPCTQSISEIKSWLSDINPSYTGDQFSPYSWNCGSCALAVFKRLSGDTSAVAGADMLTPVHEVESVTMKNQIQMTPSEISNYLINQGPGSHAVVGVDRSDDSGHWFNAFI